MLSNVSLVSQADTPLGGGCGNVFMSSQGGFTPWENFESFFVSDDHRSGIDLEEHGIIRPESKPDLRSYHVGLGSGLDNPNKNSLESNQVSNGDYESPNQASTITSSGSDDPEPDLNQISGGSNSASSSDDLDDRKRKRKISNRESARRSRMRKQSHIENLKTEADRLKHENEEGSNRLRFITHNIHHIRSDNDRLMGEYIILQRRLINLNQIWQLQQIHRNIKNNIDYHDTSACTPMQIINRRTNEQIIFP